MDVGEGRRASPAASRGGGGFRRSRLNGHVGIFERCHRVLRAKWKGSDRGFDGNINEQEGMAATIEGRVGRWQRRALSRTPRQLERAVASAAAAAMRTEGINECDLRMHAVVASCHLAVPLHWWLG